MGGSRNRLQTQTQGVFNFFHPRGLYDRFNGVTDQTNLDITVTGIYSFLVQYTYSRRLRCSTFAWCCCWWGPTLPGRTRYTHTRELILAKAIYREASVQDILTLKYFLWFLKLGLYLNLKGS